MSSGLQKNLVFVSGKGGVGKTVVSQAVARRFATEGARTLWVAFEDPTRPGGELVQAAHNLWHLNCEATTAFEEYAAMKIGMAALTRLFLQNKLVRYLAKAAPGIHELVLLGKVWHERQNYDHVVVDMPSTGYGLAMFQSTQNFTSLFKSGPLYKDSEEMLASFRNPNETAQLIVSLPEEMPLRESLELNDFLKCLFPGNPPSFLVNKKFPHVSTEKEESESPPDSWSSPFATDKADYALKRSILESYNLRLWTDAGLEYAELDYIPPRSGLTRQRLIETLASQLGKKGIA